MSGAGARRPAAAAAFRRGLARTEQALLLGLALSISLSISASEITFLGALALRLVRLALGDRLRLPGRSVVSSLALLAGVWVVAGFLAPEAWESVARVHRLYLALVIFVVFEATVQPAAARRLALAYLAGALAGAVYGLGHWLARLPTTPEYYRLEGAFSTSMTAGNLLAVGVVAALVLASELGGRARLLGLASLVATAVALFASGTRSSWLGAGAGGALGLALTRHRRGLAALLAAGLVLVLLVPMLRARALSVLDLSHRTVQGRISLWKSGAELLRERPLLGWGLADHGERIRAHRRPDATFEAGHFHSNPVQVAVSTGALGLLAYALFHAAILAALWRRRRLSPWARAGLAVWLCFHVAGLFDWSFGDAEVTYQYFFWMGLGLGSSPEPR